VVQAVEVIVDWVCCRCVMDDGDGKVEVRVRVSLLPGGFKANDVTERQLCGFVYFLLYITVKLVRRG
jgi:hypothetical protein